MSSSREAISVEQAQRPFFVGVDVGGSSIKIGLLDDLGRSLGRTRIPTRQEEGPEDAVQRIQWAVRQLLANLSLTMDDVAALGLGTPGTMDIPAGMILEPPNLPNWRHFPIRDRLSAACGRPVSFANDGNAAAYGEFWIGRGKEFHSIVLLTLGTGVGGGIIIGEMSIQGENSCGSECGHIVIDCRETARVCNCGQRGHLEAYASATALVQQAEELLRSERKTSLRARLNAGESLTTLLLAQEAEAGDPLSLELVLDAAAYLGFGAVSLMHTIDPGAVILGGAMNFGGHGAKLGRRFLERVREVVRNHTFPILAQRTTIDFAMLGGDAGYIGAAGIARADYRKTGGK